MIMLTGFEPFGGDTPNPSWQAVLGARGILTGEGHEVEAVQLPCVFNESREALAEAMGRLDPELVISAGLAGGRARISLERVAINCDDARIPDNKGRRPVDQAVVEGGPAAYFTTLPIKAALRDLQIEGINADISQSAGTYVCNHVFYGLMHDLATSGRQARGGFVHVPWLPGQAGTQGPSMELDQMARGLAVIAKTTLATPVDARLAGGALH